MIRLIAAIAFVWFLLSVLFAVAWAWFMSRLDDDMDDADVVAEAERILFDADFDQMWGP